MSDPAVEQGWQRVLDEWDDDRAHQAFLDLCVMTDRLAVAAARYRQMKEDPIRGPRAEQRLAAIALSAIARLEATRIPKSRHRLHSAAVAAAVILLAAALAWLLNVIRAV